MFHVVVVVGTGTAAVVVLIKPPLFLHRYIYIDIDISDIEYTAKDSHFYGRPQKASGSPSRLAHHAESLVVDVPLSPAGATRRGVGRVGLSSPRSTAAQGTD